MRATIAAHTLLCKRSNMVLKSNLKLETSALCRGFLLYKLASGVQIPTSWMAIERMYLYLEKEFLGDRQF
jgi:hypothetical protein